jgi:formate hydrogenlyase subunit 6/NADH:ubiquinone oxidoreductase subunit I
MRPVREGLPVPRIEIIALDKASKRFALRYDAGRCIFCAQCVQNCRFNCLELSHDEWELAGISRDAFTIWYGCDADPEPLLARCAEANPDLGG